MSDDSEARAPLPDSGMSRRSGKRHAEQPLDGAPVKLS
jgi:hypothetical protein